jgi:hypothetical protein
VKKSVKKDPLRVAARLARRHVAHAAIDEGGNNLPPLMKAAWMIDCNDTKIHSAVGPAAIVGGGMLA